MKPAANRKPAIAIGILVLVAIIAGLLLPRLIDPNRYNGRMVLVIEKALGGKVRIGHITWGLLKGLWFEVDGFEIIDASAFPIDFKTSRIHAGVAIAPLLAKKIVLKHLRLESPHVQWRLQRGPQEAVQERKPPAVEVKPAGIPLPVEIEEVLITNGRVSLDRSLILPGQPVARDFGDIEIKASNLAPGREMLFDLSMKDKAESGFGTLKAQGTFAGLTDSLTLQNPKLTVHAIVSALHTNALKPYLGNAPWVQRLSGSLSAAVNYEGDLGSHHRAEGSMDISRVAFSDPSSWEASLPGTETKITYRANLQANDLTVENLEVKLGRLSMRARGSVLNLKERPVIKNAVFSADLPLLDTVPLVPWKFLGGSTVFLRSALEGGGKVEIEQAVLPSIDLSEPFEGLLPGIDSTFRISGVSLELSPVMPRITNIDASVRLLQGVAYVQMSGAQFSTVNLPTITGQVTKLFEEPRIEATVKGSLRVNKPPPEDLAGFFRRCGLEEVSGSADLDAAVLLDTSQPANVQVRGNIGIRGVQVRTSLSPARLEGLRADLAITPEVAKVTNLSTVVTVPVGPSTPRGRFEIELEGRVDEWSRRPAVILQRMKTSSVALPVVASLIPWEKLGESAEPVKQTLLHGGTVTVEEISLPKVELSSLPKSPALLLPRAKAAVSFAGVVVQPYLSLPGFKDIKGRIHLENGVLTGTGVQGRMGPLSLPALEIRVSRLAARPKVAVAAKGPVQLAATSDTRVEDLFKRYGLRSLVVSADVDVRADFDAALHEGWVADGSLVLANVRAETYPEGVIMENLQGRVTVNRDRATNITVENIKGQVNQAPVRLSGKILGVGTRNLVIDAKASAKQLDLAHLRELIPALKKLSLAGMVDMDLDVYIPYAAPKNSRLSGTLKTRNLNFQLAHMTVEKGNSEWNLTGNTALIRRAQVRINDTVLAVTGRIANPVEPNIQLHATSRDLDLDRFIPPPRAEESEDKPSPKEGSRDPEKAMKTEWSPGALRTTAHIQVEADTGRYRGIQFQKLKMDATYHRGVLKQCDLRFDTKGGRVAITGSGDIRDPERVTFAVSPNITSLPVESITPVFGIPDLPVRGPISLSGQLQGRTGSSGDFLNSLRGNLDARIGPGKLARIGGGGDFIARMLSLTSIRGILTGSVFENFASQGLPFRRMRAQTTFQNGDMDMTNFRFESDAMNIDAQGRVKLLEEKMDIGARLKPLSTVSTVAGAVPLVGKVAASLTEIYFNVTGPWDDPLVSIIPGQGLADSIQNQAKGVSSALKGAVDLLGREGSK
jgi:hypothetical protein